MSTCVVTGGAGFIGSHIVEALVQRGDRVRVLDNLCTGYRDNLAAWAQQVEFTEGEITDGPLVARILKGADFVFHQAALASVPRSVERPLDTNLSCVTGTLTVLDEARKAGVRRVVYAASSSAYGNLPYSSKRETDLPTPLSPYAVAKLAGEYYCQAFFHTYGLETVSLRYFNVFGPRQDPNSPYSAVIPLFIQRLMKKESPTIYGDGQQTRDFTYVGNVVQANLRAAEAKHAAGRSFNVASGRSFSLLQLMDRLNHLLGTKVAPQFQPERTGDVRDSLADISQTRAILGYDPAIDFDAGLERTVAYYRGQ